MTSVHCVLNKLVMYCKVVFFALLAVAVAVPASGGLVGGKEPADLNDETLKNLVNQVVESTNENVVVVKLVSATKQVVAGAKYEVVFEATDKSTHQTKTCETTFVSQPWLEKKLVISNFKCEVKQS